MLNEVTLIGNLGADPEVRNTKSGTAVTNLRVATTERRKGADGNWVDHTEWHRVVLFGKAAENAQKYLKKGRQVWVRGKLRTSKFTDKEGHERFSTDVVGDEIKFLGGNDKREGNQERVENWDAKPAAAGTKSENWATEDDIPF